VQRNSAIDDTFPLKFENFNMPVMSVPTMDVESLDSQAMQIFKAMQIAKHEFTATQDVHLPMADASMKMTTFKKILEAPLSYEIEMRMGVYFGWNFVPGVMGPLSFNYMKSFLSTLGQVSIETSSIQIFRINEHNAKQNKSAGRTTYRFVTTSNGAFLEKKTALLHQRLDNYEEGWRVSTSTEEEISFEELDKAYGITWALSPTNTELFGSDLNLDYDTITSTVIDAIQSNFDSRTGKTSDELVQDTTNEIYNTFISISKELKTAAIKTLSTSLATNGLKKLYLREVGCGTEDEKVMTGVFGFNPIAMTRDRTRYSVVVPDTPYRVDLTLVQERSRRRRNTSGRPRVIYEMEVERIGEGATPEGMMDVYNQVARASFAVPFLPTTLSERANAILEYNSFFQLNDGSITPGYTMVRHHLNKPRNIKMNDFISKRFDQFAVTIKLNGTRMQLFINSNGDTYAMIPPRGCWLLNRGNVGVASTILDGELFIDENGDASFYAFDILIESGKDVRNLPMYVSQLIIEKVTQENTPLLSNIGVASTSRLEHVSRVMSRIQSPDDVKYVAKQFLLPSGADDAYTSSAMLLKQIESMPADSTDGLVYESASSYNAKKTNTLKWKPARDMTIDFAVTRTAKGLYVISTIKNGKLSIFRGTRAHPVNPVIEPNMSVAEYGNLDGYIVECKWSSEISRFVPIRVRSDRTEPNGERVALDVWEDIINPIDTKTITGQGMVLLRRFHNQLKKTMLTSYARNIEALLDIGSGRGGDLNKWESLKIGHVYAVDPSTQNMSVLRSRAKSMGLSTSGKDARITPITRSIVDVSDKIVPDESADVISSFFSLTYMFDTQSTLEKTADEIARIIRDQGHFIGTMMDGDRVRNLLDQNASTTGTAKIVYPGSFSILANSNLSETFGSSVIVNLDDSSSMVHNQREYLTNFDALRTMLAERGMKLQQHFVLDASKTGLPVSNKAFSDLNVGFVFVYDDADEEDVSDDDLEISTNDIPLSEKDAVEIELADEVDELVLDDDEEVINDDEEVINDDDEVFVIDYLDEDETQSPPLLIQTPFLVPSASIVYADIGNYIGSIVLAGLLASDSTNFELPIQELKAHGRDYLSAIQKEYPRFAVPEFTDKDRANTLLKTFVNTLATNVLVVNGNGKELVRYDYIVNPKKPKPAKRTTIFVKRGDTLGLIVTRPTTSTLNPSEKRVGEREFVLPDGSSVSWKYNGVSDLTTLLQAKPAKGKVTPLFTNTSVTALSTVLKAIKKT
jgi:hypothetical protein